MILESSCFKADLVIDGSSNEQLQSNREIKKEIICFMEREFRYHKVFALLKLESYFLPQFQKPVTNATILRGPEKRGAQSINVFQLDVFAKHRESNRCFEAFSLQCYVTGAESSLNWRRFRTEEESISSGNFQPPSKCLH
mmetsp:Transcript_16282/g.44164  ORF Transcript_16282/g.44164 Transcript_16282/m.44164 type:complete len:140 (-) Transcript_16282:46-465(-)